MNWSYLFKHWFSTILIAPIVSDVITYYYTDTQTMFNLTSIFPVTSILGLVFSAPTYIIYAIVYNFLAKKEVKPEYSKAVLICISVIGIFLSFYVIFNNREENTTLGYSLTSIFFGIFYKLNFKESATREQSSNRRSNQQ